jgi:NAD(P)-dependent dehydrogenase (short-subunit alcohol dehydrogenase family)
MSTHDRRLVGESEGNHNATIVLTGAPTGIGRTTALAIAERGPWSTSTRRRRRKRDYLVRAIDPSVAPSYAVPGDR